MSCKHCNGIDYGESRTPWFDENGNSGALVWFPGEPTPVIAVNMNARDAEACASVAVRCCPWCGEKLGGGAE